MLGLGSLGHRSRLSFIFKFDLLQTIFREATDLCRRLTSLQMFTELHKVTGFSCRKNLKVQQIIHLILQIPNLILLHFMFQIVCFVAALTVITIITDTFLILASGYHLSWFCWFQFASAFHFGCGHRINFPSHGWCCYRPDHSGSRGEDGS